MKLNIKQTLIEILESLLRLIHPIIPYITEAIWQKIIRHEGGNNTIMLADYPIVNKRLINIQYRRPINYLKEILICIRSLRQQFKLAGNLPIELIIYFNTAKPGWKKDQDAFILIKDILIKLAIIKKIVILDHPATEYYHCSIVKIVKRTLLYFIIEISPLQIKNELTIIYKLLNNIQKKISILVDQLNNTKFLKKAPSNIIEEIKDRLIIQQTKEEELRLQSNLFLALNTKNLN